MAPGFSIYLSLLERGFIWPITTKAKYTERKYLSREHHANLKRDTEVFSGENQKVKACRLLEYLVFKGYCVLLLTYYRGHGINKHTKIDNDTLNKNYDFFGEYRV